jgi:hypothetical protein
LDIFDVVESDKDTCGNLKSVSMETREILEELNRDYKAPAIKEEEKKVADKFNAVSFLFYIIFPTLFAIRTNTFSKCRKVMYRGM